MARSAAAVAAAAALISSLVIRSLCMSDSGGIV